MWECRNKESRPAKHTVRNLDSTLHYTTLNATSYLQRREEKRREKRIETERGETKREDEQKTLYSVRNLDYSLNTTP